MVNQIMWTCVHLLLLDGKVRKKKAGVNNPGPPGWRRREDEASNCEVKHYSGFDQDVGIFWGM